MSDRFGTLCIKERDKSKTVYESRKICLGVICLEVNARLITDFKNADKESDETLITFDHEILVLNHLPLYIYYALLFDIIFFESAVP